MAKYRHLNSEDRSHIETGLNNRQSFKEIGEKVGKDCSTISKEIRSHMVFKKTGAYGRPFRIRCTVARGEKIELSVAIQAKVEVTPSNWNFGFQPTKNFFERIYVVFNKGAAAGTQPAAAFSRVKSPPEKFSNQ